MRSTFFLLLLACACAGSGKSYPCDPGLGQCGTVELPDGGHSAPAFISDPFIVWHDGAHDASADSTAFGGAIFAAFRHAANWSGDASARVFVVRSDDQGRSWRKTAELAVSGRDPRQPRLFVFAGKLWILATVWDASDPTKHQTSLRVSASADGATWTPFAELSQTTGMAGWRPRQYGALLYLSVWGADELFPAAQPTAFSLLSSSDCALFVSAQAPAAGPGAREGDMLTRANGERWMAIPQRSVADSRDKLSICHAGSGPWSCWNIPGLSIEAPALFEWQGSLFLAGKRETGGGIQRTSIWQVLEDMQDLSPVGDVPSGIGDTGGPSVVPLDNERALLVFHSTSRQDPRVAALGREPTATEAEAQGYAADVLAVELYMSAAAGR